MQIPVHPSSLRFIVKWKPMHHYCFCVMLKQESFLWYLFRCLFMLTDTFILNSLFNNDHLRKIYISTKALYHYRLMWSNNIPLIPFKIYFLISYFLNYVSKHIFLSISSHYLYTSSISQNNNFYITWQWNSVHLYSRATAPFELQVKT